MIKTAITLAIATILQLPLGLHLHSGNIPDAGGSSGGFAQAPKPLKPLASVKFDTVTELQPIEVPVAPTPTPVPVSQNGCVTGYVSGDYYLDKIIQYESGGNSCATNPGGCFGLLQACPGAPLREACGGVPACQIKWFIDNKTGGRSWAEVWQHELDYGWW